MKVLKRLNTIVEFDKSYIQRAIEGAMGDTKEGIDYHKSEDLTEKVVELLMENHGESSTVNIEDIQDAVENVLYEHSSKELFTKFILYRNDKSKERKKKKNLLNNRLLSDEFISHYKHLPSPMKHLGEFVYYRTYSRYLKDLERREYWWETVRRAVEYNCGLVNASRGEAEELFDNIFHLRQFLSGRTFWVGNTDVSKNYPMANYNCSFTILDDIESFRDLFYLLMIGSGVGVRILKEDVAKIPKIRTDFELINKDYSPLPKDEREDNTTLEFFYNHTAKITIGDSKEGWVQSLDFFLKLISSNEYRHIKTIIMDYDHVRPKGEKLETFGGTASGHESLKNMYKKIYNIINKIKVDAVNNKVKLKPINCLDIANIIGENVVVGGVRRTAEIILIDADDQECIDAKKNLYKQIDGKWVVDKDIIHRQMSNNSIYYKQKPTRERLHWQIERMRYSGEPAWVNAEAGAKRRENFNGVNP